MLVMQPIKAEINNQTLAVLVNINDPESIEIGRYYQQARLLPDRNVIYLDFTANTDSLTKSEFNNVESQIKEKMPDNIQAYALAWRKPWRVDCMSITSAFSLGFSKDYCAIGCKRTKPVNYFNSNSTQPYTDLRIHPSMMLSANSVEAVKRMIDRGVSADYTRPVASAYLVSTGDMERNVRAVHYPVIKKSLGRLLDVKLLEADAIKNRQDVMFYFTGLEKVKFIDTNRYMPGAISDHLTSTGGHLFSGKQMSVLDWIDSGVSGTYGAVVEPCNFIQKFPNPGIVMQKYLSGNSLIEAYWKSVKMPGQGVFIGEPLASPYKNCKMVISRKGDFQYIKNTVKNLIERKYRNCN